MHTATALHNKANQCNQRAPGTTSKHRAHAATPEHKWRHAVSTRSDSAGCRHTPCTTKRCTPYPLSTYQFPCGTTQVLISSSSLLQSNPNGGPGHRIRITISRLQRPPIVALLIVLAAVAQAGQAAYGCCAPTAKHIRLGSQHTRAAGILDRLQTQKCRLEWQQNSVRCMSMNVVDQLTDGMGLRNTVASVIHL